MGGFSRRILLLAGVLGALGAGACDRNPASRPGGAARIASLVPAATEILLEIGAADSLVAVSNYDTNPAVSRLPRVGDYLNTEWETLAAVKPDAMIIQAAPDRIPAGLKQKAGQLGIRLVNIHIDRLEDIYPAMRQIGQAAGREEAANKSADALKERLEQIRAACEQRTPLRVLLVRDVDGRDVVGPSNYLDDLLKIVHATNAAEKLANPYPSIDRETILSLAPQVVIVLLPDARPQDVERSNRFWDELTRLPALAHTRVYTLVERHTLLPGPRIADLAGRIAECLDGTKPK